MSHFSSPKTLFQDSRRSASGLLLLGVAALTLLCSCGKAPEPPPAAPPTPVPLPTAIPVPPTPVPTPVPPGPPTPTPIVHHYAPDGIYYVTEEVTVRLKAGLMGVAPGTQVKRLSEHGDTVTVNDGTQEFELKKTQLTNDLDEAAKIQKLLQQNQLAGDAFRAQQQAAYEKQQQAQIEYYRSHPLGGGVGPGTPSPAPAH